MRLERTGSALGRAGLAALVAALVTLGLVPVQTGSATAAPAEGGSAQPALPVTAAAYPGLTVTTVLRDLNMAVNAKVAPSGRIFVAGKEGVVTTYAHEGDVNPKVTVDLREVVFSTWDRGLLGMTLDPAFESGRPYLYLLYSYDRDPFGSSAVPRWGGIQDQCPTPPGDSADGCTTSGRLVRFTIDPLGVAVPGSEKVILDGAATAGGGWCMQFSSHSIGTVEFGPDGMLYVGAGDGASFGAVDYGQFGGSAGSPTPVNPCNDGPAGRGTTPTAATSLGGALRAQAVRGATASSYVSWNGAILRINPDTGNAAAGNPLLGNGIDNDDRIVAYGLRNPYRFAFRPGTKQLWLGDVGWGTYEEINTFVTGSGQTKVPNFGWPCQEGPNRQPRYEGTHIGLCDSLYARPTQTLGGVSSPLVNPQHSWQRRPASPVSGCADTGGGAATGGPFVTNPAWPTALKGAYVFADYVRGCIVAMPLTAGKPDPAKSVLLVNGVTPVALQPGPDGDIYFVDVVQGTLNRIRSVAGNLPPTARFTATPQSGAPPLNVKFDASASTDPNPGEVLTYTWDLDGDGDCDDATGVTAQRTYTSIGTVNVRLCVVDQLGESDSTTQPVNVGNAPPTVVLTSSADSNGWAVGSPITFSANATDPDGSLPDSAFSWVFEIRHCTDQSSTSCHTHELGTQSGGRTATITGPDHDYYAYVRARVTVTDAQGATGTDTHDAAPRISTITLATSPSGLPVNVAGTAGPAPTSGKALENGIIQLIVPATAPRPGAFYTFAGWADPAGAGAGPSRQVSAPPGASTFTATYTLSNRPPKLTAIRLSPTSATLGTAGKRFVISAAVADVTGLSRVTGTIKGPDGRSRSVTMTKQGDRFVGSILLTRATAAPGRHTTSVTAVDTAGASITLAGPNATIRR